MIKRLTIIPLRFQQCRFFKLERNNRFVKKFLGVFISFSIRGDQDACSTVLLKKHSPFLDGRMPVPRLKKFIAPITGRQPIPRMQKSLPLVGRASRPASTMRLLRPAVLCTALLAMTVVYLSLQATVRSEAISSQHGQPLSSTESTSLLSKDCFVLPCSARPSSQ